MFGGRPKGIPFSSAKSKRGSAFHHGAPSLRSLARPDFWFSLLTHCAQRAIFLAPLPAWDIARLGGRQDVSSYQEMPWRTTWGGGTINVPCSASRNLLAIRQLSPHSSCNVTLPTPADSSCRQLVTPMRKAPRSNGLGIRISKLLGKIEINYNIFFLVAEGRC